MVVTRALRASGCAHCRLSLLQSFTSLTGPSFRTPRISARLPRCATPSLQRRHSSRLTYNGQELDVRSNESIKGAAVEDHLIQDSAEEWDELEEAEEEVQVAAVPWYLQVE